MDFYSMPQTKVFTLISSEACNLNCSYCEIAQHINKEKHKEINEEIKKSLVNGNTLKKIKEIFNDLKIDNQNIEVFSLWGQEPTLTLEETLLFIKEFYLLCPNIKKFFFSTNGVNYGNRIVKYIQGIDSFVNNNVNIDIQISYDGKENTLKERGINSEIIINNIKNIINQLNHIELNKVKIRFFIHNVINPSIINKYGNDNISDEECLFYIDDITNFPYQFIELNKNSKVIFEERIVPGIECPIIADKTTGENITKLYKKFSFLTKDKKYKYKFWEEMLVPLYGIYTQRQRIINFDNIINNISYFLNNQNEMNLNNKEFIQLSEHCACGYGEKSIKIRYDGTILQCQNNIYGLKEENFLDKNDFNYKIEKFLLNKNYNPNVSIKNYFNYLYRGKLIQNEGFFILFNNTLNIMKILLKNNQIDISYKNPEKMFRHALYLINANCCNQANLMTTGSIFNRSIDWIRLFCNGLLDCLDEQILTDQKDYKNDR